MLETVYEEAYEDPELGPTLKKAYPTLGGFQQAVPGLILRHNLHGIDIDLRATQITALALWLRVQRAYQALGLKGTERPKITKSNIVCAEPMPGEKELLGEFVAELRPKVLGQLVQAIFDKMALASEAGSLLKIEDEITDAVEAARKQWLTRPKEDQLTLFPIEKRSKAEQMSLFDVSGITEEQFWDEAEARVVDTLHGYARQAANGRGLVRQLFVEDTERTMSTRLLSSGGSNSCNPEAYSARLPHAPDSFSRRFRNGVRRSCCKKPGQPFLPTWAMACWIQRWSRRRRTVWRQQVENRIANPTASQKLGCILR